MFGRAVRCAALVALPGALASACATDPPPPPPLELAGDEVGLTPREVLGKRLFEDPSLSNPPGAACASCHAPERAFASDADAADPVAPGAGPGQSGTRNAPSLLYARFVPPFGVTVEETARDGYTLAPRGGLFWDGRASSLEQQAKVPLLDPREMANASGADVVAAVRAGPSASLFDRVLEGRAVDEGAAFDAIGSAIGAYLRTPRFAPFSSRFDGWLRGDGTLSEVELRGLRLFEDRTKGNCVACHARKPGSHEPRDWLFTGWTYEALGVPRNAAIPDNDEPDSHDLGLCGRPGVGAVVPRQIEIDDYCGAFRVPSLRNVAVTAPYMHNGYFTTLTEVVRFYATRDTHPERWYGKKPDGTVDVFDDVPPAYRGNVNTFEVPYDRRPGEAPRLDDGEIDAIVAFLGTLTDA